MIDYDSFSRCHLTDIFFRFSRRAKELTLLWYHGVNMTPGLFDRLNIPNFEIISFHLASYFLCRFLSTVSIHSILILMLPFLYILHFICLRSY